MSSTPRARPRCRFDPLTVTSRELPPLVAGWGASRLWKALALCGAVALGSPLGCRCRAPSTDSSPSGTAVRALELSTQPRDPGAAPSPTSDSPPTRAAVPTEPDTTHFSLVFASCSKTDKPQPLWKPIRALKPDVFLWLGDIIYADSEDVTVHRELYGAQSRVPEYQALKSETRVIGIWDDHDYGLNDGGEEYPSKRESQTALLDFLEEPPDSPRRQQRGAYTSYDFGTPPHRVRVVLLDLRSERGDSGTQIMSEAQWSWLNSQLANSTAQVHLIGSGIQVLSNEHRWESWGRYPSELTRLLKLIQDTQVLNPVLLSGDRHFAEISKRTLSPNGFELFDFTSSGFTHSALGFIIQDNPLRVGQPFSDLNFGVVHVDWLRSSIQLEARDQGGQVQLQATLPLKIAQAKPQ